MGAVSNTVKNILVYFKEVRIELKRVNWPSRQELFRFTAVVVVGSTLVGVFLGTLDIVFQRLLLLATNFFVL